MGAVCTCQEMDKWTNHQEHCALWDDLGFLRGTSAWHPTEKRVVTFLEWLEANPGSWSDKLDEWPALVRVHEWGEERHLDLVNQGANADDAEQSVVEEVVDALGIPTITKDQEVVQDTPDILEQLAQEALEEIQHLAELAPDPTEALDNDGIVIQAPKLQYKCPHCESLEMYCAECGLHCTLCDCINDEYLLMCQGCQHLSSRPTHPAHQTNEPEPMKSKNKGAKTGKTPKGGKPNQNTKPKEPPKCSCIGECLKKDQHAPKEPKCLCAKECKLWCSKYKLERASEDQPWDWAVPYCSCKPPKTTQLYCFSCDVDRKKVTDPWRWDQNPVQSWMGAGYGGGGGFSKCRHYDFALTLPNGVVIWPSSLNNNRKEDDPAPDFGIYCASSWDPSCLAYMIAWPDYGTPKYKKAAVAAIKEGYERAKNGQKVEIGCIGGHGRTGTAVACMAVLAGVPGKDAVKWVKENYCDHAVESTKQEWFVLWFEANEKGWPLPEEPKPAPKVSSSSTPKKDYKGECPGCGHHVPGGSDVYCQGVGCKCICTEAFRDFDAELNKVDKTPYQFTQLDVLCPACKHQKPKAKSFCELGNAGCKCVCNKELANAWNWAEMAKLLPDFRTRFNSPDYKGGKVIGSTTSTSTSKTGVIVAGTGSSKCEECKHAKSSHRENYGCKTCKCMVEYSQNPPAATSQTPLPLTTGGGGACPKDQAPSPTTTPRALFSSTEVGSSTGPCAYCLHPDCNEVMGWAQERCHACNTGYAPLFWINRKKEADERKRKEEAPTPLPHPVFVPPEREAGSTAGDFVWTGVEWVHKLSQMARSFFSGESARKKGER